MNTTYLYRLGDGNEGNYPRFLITLKPEDDPYAAIAALVENRYIAGRRVRRHIVKNLAVEGEPEYGVLATVYEGPDGEQAFGAAWITAELEPLKPEDVDHYEGQSLLVHYLGVREAVDAPAYRRYRAALKLGRIASMIIVRRGYNAGQTIKELAALAGKSTTTIRRWLAITGLHRS